MSKGRADLDKKIAIYVIVFFVGMAVMYGWLALNGQIVALLK